MIMQGFVDKAMRQQAAAKEEAVTELMGIRFRSSARVRVQKPRWMPWRIYRYLMRTIVVEETPWELVNE